MAKTARSGSGRKMVDCRDTPSVNNCSVAISGSEDEVIRLAARHSIEDHGHEDTPELYENIKASMKDA